MRAERRQGNKIGPDESAPLFVGLNDDSLIDASLNYLYGSTVFGFRACYITLVPKEGPEVISRRVFYTLPLLSIAHRYRPSVRCFYHLPLLLR